jgi:hypothetical protein
MTTGTVACFSLPRTGKPRRKRGQTVLSRLVSTDAFTNHPTLTVPKRMLILFLVVVLADDHGSLASLHERLQETGETDEGHWAHGRDVKSLQNSTSKCLGKNAVRAPKWELIAECLRLQIPPEHLPPILAVAAGLYCHARELTGPPDGYSGPVHLPEWARHTRVTPETISDHLRQLLTPLAPQAADLGEEPAVHGELDVGALIDECERLRTLLSAVLRGTRALEKEAEEQRARAEYFKMSAEVQTEQFVENHRIQRELREVRRRFHRLEALYAAQLAKAYHGISRATIQDIIDQQIDAAAGVRTQRPVWEFATLTAGQVAELPGGTSSVS